MIWGGEWKGRHIPDYVQFPQWITLDIPGRHPSVEWRPSSSLGTREAHGYCGVGWAWPRATAEKVSVPGMVSQGSCSWSCTQCKAFSEETAACGLLRLQGGLDCPWIQFSVKISVLAKQVLRPGYLKDLKFHYWPQFFHGFNEHGLVKSMAPSSPTKSQLDALSVSFVLVAVSELNMDSPREGISSLSETRRQLPYCRDHRAGHFTLGSKIKICFIWK